MVHNAVGGAIGSVLAISPDVLQQNFQVNTMALLHLAQATAPAMIERWCEGAFVVTGNTGGLSWVRRISQALRRLRRRSVF